MLFLITCLALCIPATCLLVDSLNYSNLSRLSLLCGSHLSLFLMPPKAVDRLITYYGLLIVGLVEPMTLYE